MLAEHDGGIEWRDQNARPESNPLGLRGDEGQSDDGVERRPEWLWPRLVRGAVVRIQGSNGTEKPLEDPQRAITERLGVPSEHAHVVGCGTGAAHRETKAKPHPTAY